ENAQRGLLLLDEVPLVRDYHQGATGIQHADGDLLVLHGESLGRVDDERRRVRARDRLRGPKEAEVLDPANLDLASHPGRIDEPDRPRRPPDDGVDGVACRPRFFEDDRTPFPDKTVEQTRLADI